MPRRVLRLVLGDLQTAIRTARRKVMKAHRLYRDDGSGELTKSDFQDWISAVFQNVVSAWETFLENAFILYALGKRSPNGTSTSCNASFRTRDAVKQILRGPASYVKWNDPTTVIQLAERYFQDGTPFRIPIRNNQRLLQDILTIRNALGHGTEDVFEKYQALVRHELAHYPSGLMPVDFLMRNHGANGATYLEFYIRVIEVTGSQIVP